MTINPISPQPLPVQHAEEFVCVSAHPLLRQPIIVVLRPAETSRAPGQVFARVPGIAAHGIGAGNEAAVDDLLHILLEARNDLRRDVYFGRELAPWLRALLVFAEIVLVEEGAS